MEMLNSVWTALSTENELFAKIIVSPLTFIEVTLYFLIFTQLLNIKSTKKQRNIYIILLSCISIISSFFLPTLLRSFINMIIYPICIMIIFKTNAIKAIFAEFLPLMFLVLLETLTAKLLFVLFGISYEQSASIPLSRLGISVLIFALFYLLILVFKKSKLSIASFEFIDKKNKIIIITNSIIGVITIATQFYLASFYNENLPLIITLLSLLTLTAFFIINIFSLISVIKLRNTTQNLEESQLYNKTLQILHDNVRAFRHDFSNIVTAIGGYVSMNDMDGLKKYYSQLLIDCQRTNNLTTLSPEVINNPAIYNVLANKYHIADEKGIKIELSIFYDINKLNIKIYELTRILGILLDNAIEASAECENKIINVTVREEPNKNRKVILIENTYNNKNINTETIYEKGFSTKQGNTGLGLWQVRQILKKNTNLNLYTYKNEEYFCQQLEIYNN